MYTDNGYERIDIAYGPIDDVINQLQVSGVRMEPGYFYTFRVFFPTDVLVNEDLRVQVSARVADALSGLVPRERLIIAVGPRELIVTIDNTNTIFAALAAIGTLIRYAIAILTLVGVILWVYKELRPSPSPPPPGGDGGGGEGEGGGDGTSSAAGTYLPIVLVALLLVLLMD